MTITEPRPQAIGGGLAADEVFVAGMQRVFAAPVGTPFPDLPDDPDPPWVDLGYTTEDGLTVSIGKETDDLMTSQSLVPVRILVTGTPMTFTASFRQVNRDTIAVALGGGTVSGDDSGWHYIPPPASYIDERAYIIEGVDGANTVRFWFYRASISEAVEIPIVNTDSMVLPVTLSILDHDPPYEVDGIGPGFSTVVPLGTVAVAATATARDVQASVTGTPLR